VIIWALRFSSDRHSPPGATFSDRRLQKVAVENYKCIEHSNEFKIDRVTCLVGKNEAGKSAILEALYKLNPVEPGESRFEEMDFPRRRLTTYRDRQDTAEQANVLTTVWDLEEADVEMMNAEFGEGVLKSETVTISRGYANKDRWAIELDESKMVGHILRGAQLSEDLKTELASSATVAQLIKRLGEAPAPPAEGQPAPPHTANALAEQLKKRFRKNQGSCGAIDALNKHLPTFLYFTEYHRLPGLMSINDLVKRQGEEKLEFSDRLFLALLELAKSSPAEISEIGTSEQFIMELEAIKVQLTDEIFEFWTQNKHLEVDFRCDMGRPKDDPPFNAGYVFNTRIFNKRHRASVNFDQRSTGFIWFFSFLVWFSQVKKNYGERIIILLDEPGLSLHGRAQEDLLRYINERLRPTYQVIYSTHSPFLLDMEEIFSVRTVEDVVEKDKDGKELILGTKVGGQILIRDRDTLLPLEGILGFDVARTMFIGPNVLVVEGPAEVGYMNWFSRQLAARNREALDLRWAICPAEGASKISSFVTLFSGRGLRIAALVDYHEPQKKMIDDLEASKLLKDGYLLRTTAYASQSEADIEDLLGRSMFRFLVNGCLEIVGTPHEFPETKPKDASERLVKEAEDFNCTLPAAVPEFGHYKPVEYLLGVEDVSIIPGLDNALDRFEKLFQDLNKLLSG
jgi:predicted ATPase